MVFVMSNGERRNTRGVGGGCLFPLNFPCSSSFEGWRTRVTGLDWTFMVRLPAKMVRWEDRYVVLIVVEQCE